MTSTDRHTAIAHEMIATLIDNLPDELHDRGLDAIADTLNVDALILMTNAIHDSRRARLANDEFPAALLALNNDDAACELDAYCDTNSAPACCTAAARVINSIYEAADYND